MRSNQGRRKSLNFSRKFRGNYPQRTPNFWVFFSKKHDFLGNIVFEMTRKVVFWTPHMSNFKASSKFDDFFKSSNLEKCHISNICSMAHETLKRRWYQMRRNIILLLICSTPVPSTPSSEPKFDMAYFQLLCNAYEQFGHQKILCNSWFWHILNVIWICGSSFIWSYSTSPCWTYARSHARTPFFLTFIHLVVHSFYMIVIIL